MIRINAPDLNTKTEDAVIPLTHIEPVQGNPLVAGEYTVMASCNWNFSDNKNEACYILQGSNNTFWICKVQDFNERFKR